MSSIPLQTNEYSAVPQRDGEDDVDDLHLQTKPSNTRWRLSTLASSTVLPWVLHVLLLVVNIFTFYYLTHKYSQKGNCIETPTNWSPAIDQDLVHFVTIPINGSLAHTNSFKGLPNPDRDAAWANISTAVPRIKLTSQDLDRLQKYPYTAATTSSPVGKEEYVGQLEVYELLSCLDSLRKAIYREKYPELEEGKEGFDATKWHSSLDQCIDILRVEIMCESDVSIVTYEKDTGDADFTTVKKCRDFDALRLWSFSDPNKNDRVLPTSNR